MTTKFKIIAGFTVMTLLVLLVAVSGYRNAITFADSFATANRISLMNTDLSDIVAALQEMRGAYYRYFTTDDPKDMDTAQAAVDKAQMLIEDAANVTAEPARREKLKALSKVVDPLTNCLKELLDSRRNLSKVYETEVRPAYHAAFEAFNKMSAQAHDEEDVHLLHALGSAWELIANITASLGRFSESCELDDAQQSIERVEKLSASLNDLKVHVKTEESAKLFDNVLMKSHAALDSALKDMMRDAKIADAAWKTVQERTGGALKTLLAENDAINKEERENIKTGEAANEAAKRLSLILAVCGVLAGAVIACLIVFNIIRILTRVSAFATAVSGGDVEARCAVKEKGEIGAMVDAIEAIPGVLKQMRDGFLALAGKIQRGDIAARGRQELYRNGFAEIVGACNASLAALLSVIEEMPNPVVVLNTDHRAEYLNGQGRR
ncbi:MAG: MCP four helix bundle domain-containing protein, partial [Desulfovibrio sp.]|nr:MCP four helix bundle domain-containing protein [Desulfovibrio sp.]